MDLNDLLAKLKHNNNNNNNDEESEYYGDNPDNSAFKEENNISFLLNNNNPMIQEDSILFNNKINISKTDLNTKNSINNNNYQNTSKIDLNQSKQQKDLLIKNSSKNLNKILSSKDVSNANKDNKNINNINYNEEIESINIEDIEDLGLVNETSKKSSIYVNNNKTNNPNLSNVKNYYGSITNNNSNYFTINKPNNNNNLNESLSAIPFSETNINNNIENKSKLNKQRSSLNISDIAQDAAERQSIVSKSNNPFKNTNNINNIDRIKEEDKSIYVLKNNKDFDEIKSITSNADRYSNVLKSNVQKTNSFKPYNELINEEYLPSKNSFNKENKDENIKKLKSKNSLNDFKKQISKKSTFINENKDYEDIFENYNSNNFLVEENQDEVKRKNKELIDKLNIEEKENEVIKNLEKIKKEEEEYKEKLRIERELIKEKERKDQEEQEQIKEKERKEKEKERQRILEEERLEEERQEKEFQLLLQKKREEKEKKEKERLKILKEEEEELARKEFEFQETLKNRKLNEEKKKLEFEETSNLKQNTRNELLLSNKEEKSNDVNRLKTIKEAEEEDNEKSRASKLNKSEKKKSNINKYKNDINNDFEVEDIQEYEYKNNENKYAKSKLDKKQLVKNSNNNNNDNNVVNNISNKYISPEFEDLNKSNDNEKPSIINKNSNTDNNDYDEDDNIDLDIMNALDKKTKDKEECTLSNYKENNNQNQKTLELHKSINNKCDDFNSDKDDEIDSFNNNKKKESEDYNNNKITKDKKKQEKIKKNIKNQQGLTDKTYDILNSNSLACKNVATNIEETYFHQTIGEGYDNIFSEKIYSFVRRKEALLSNKYYKDFVLNQVTYLDKINVTNRKYFKDIDDNYRELISDPKTGQANLSSFLNKFYYDNYEEFLKEMMQHSTNAYDSLISNLCTFKSINSLYKVKPEMSKDFPYLRNTTSDGNSFYRIFIFAYLENLVLNFKIEELIKFYIDYYRMNQAVITENNNDSIFYRNILIVLAEIIKYLNASINNKDEEDNTDNKYLQSAYNLLINAFNHSKENHFSILLTEHIRSVLLQILLEFEGEIKESSNIKIKDKYNKGDNYNKDEVDEPYSNRIGISNFEAIKLSLQLICLMYNVNINIHVFDGSYDKSKSSGVEVYKVNFSSFSELAKDDNNIAQFKNISFEIDMIYNYSYYMLAYNNDSFIHKLKDRLEDLYFFENSYYVTEKKQCNRCKTDGYFVIIPFYNVSFCMECAKSFINSQSKKRVSTMCNENFNNREYYTNGFEIMNNIKINEPFFSNIFNENISNLIVKYSNNLCFFCSEVKDSNETVYLLESCGCKFCFDCLKAAVEQSTYGFYYLNTFDKALAKAKKLEGTKCKCGCMFSNDDSIKILEKEANKNYLKDNYNIDLEEYKEKSIKRQLSYSQTNCLSCGNSCRKETDIEIDNEYFQNKNYAVSDYYKILPIAEQSSDNNINTSSANHIICNDCIDQIKQKDNKNDPSIIKNINCVVCNVIHGVNKVVWKGVLYPSPCNCIIY